MAALYLSKTSALSIFSSFFRSSKVLVFCLLTGLLLGFIGLGPKAAYGQVIPVPAQANPPKLVNDLTNTLSQQEQNELEDFLVKANDSTTVQIAVLIVPTTGDEPIEDFAIKVFNTWGIGQKDKNNGVLLCIAMQDRKFSIETGYGVEAVIADADANQILREHLKPNFKEQRYCQGIKETVENLYALAKGDYIAKAPPAKAPKEKGGSGWLFWVVLFIIIIAVMSKRGGGGRGGRNRNRGGGGFPVFLPMGGGGSSWGDFSSGGGSFGGGFGGFGGGRSGGGGASGGW